MKKTLLLFAAVAALVCSCGKPKPTPEADPEVSIAVTGIDNNQATISAELTAGNFYGAKIVTNVLVSAVGIDYTNEIQLINYIEANGEEIDLPFSTTVEKLRSEKDYLSAVLVYDKTGRACASAFDTWTAYGSPDGISDDNNAGSLDENKF